ncbi:MAG: phenylalanyl-tRNA synthetase beta chain [Actinomycetota bacterium]
MKVTLSWLQEFAPFPSDDPVALGDVMSDLGMAVETIERVGEGLDGIIVAKVLALRPHPDANKIQLVDVDCGDGEPLQICCGAFNMSVGDLVPLATLGTVMPDGMEIARRKMRGEWSNGMLCSGRELGLGDDHSGIYILDSSLSLGTPIATALSIVPDVIFDLDITPNRPDAFSVAGVARDLAARLGLPFAIPTQTVSTSPAQQTAKVTIQDPDLCGRFHLRLIENIKVEPSPRWIADRLVAAGMRPINNVVDASNYVMLELGQPNHTYDADKVSDGTFAIRWANEGETIETLDGQVRTLTGHRDGVITNSKNEPIGIAGVMGGASTEISESTTRVFLECAWWQPLAIARSSKFMGLRSEASARFERGTDPEMVDFAAQRFVSLLPGAVLTELSITEDGQLPERLPIAVRPARVNQLLGTSIATDTMKALLEPIGFAIETTGESFTAIAPSFRPDVTTETDVIEEIARHFGYSKITPKLSTSTQIGHLTDRQQKRRALREIAIGLGFHEAMPLPFLAPEDMANCGLNDEVITLTNPLAAEESVLRTSLRPGLLRAVAFNESHRSFAVQLFEIGKVFRRPTTATPLPDEREHFAIISAASDSRELARTLAVLGTTLGYDISIDQSRPPQGLHPGRSGMLCVGSVVVGQIGEVDPAVIEAFGLSERVNWLELDLDTLLALPASEHRYRAISRYPSSDMDFAFDVPEEVSAAQLAQALRLAAGELCVRCELFDVFRFPNGRRSLAYRLRFQSTERTLTDEDLTSARQAVLAAASALSVNLREN